MGSQVESLTLRGTLAQIEGLLVVQLRQFKFLSIDVDHAKPPICERELRIEVDRHLVVGSGFVVLPLCTFFFAQRERFERRQ